MKTNVTKKALLSSALSLVLCFTMLLGTTFAWFTDSVTSANNIIQSGNLDIELYYQTQGQTDWTKVTDTTNVFAQNALWEPGHTEVVKLKVVNEGSLALKYTLGVNVANEVGSVNVNGDMFKLSEYIKFGIVDGAQTYTRDQAIAAVDATATALKTAYNSTVTSLDAKNDTDSDEKIVTMVVYMPTTVSNEANAKAGAPVPTIHLGINLFATQQTAESDSFDNQYDKDAEFGVEVKNAYELATALSVGGLVKLTNDISVTESLNIPAGVVVNLDLNGQTITGTKGRDADNNRIHVIVNNGILTIKDGTVKSAGNDGGSAIYNNAGATLTIEDVTLYGAPQSDPVYEVGVSKPFPSYAVNNYGNAVVNGATVKSYHGAIATGDNGVTIINDADIDVGLGQSTGITSYLIYSFGNAQVTVNDGMFAFTKQEIYVNGGNTFCELGTNPIIINGGNYTSASFSTGADREYVIKGGTFDKDPTAYVANSYQVVDNGDATYTVLPKVEGAELTYYADGLYSDANSSKNYYVASGAGMDTIAEKINDGTLAKNTNITLLTDIDLTDVDYAPISGNKGDSWYTGTFDGQNHTITGMTVNAYEGGLIGSSNGTVKNVIIDGATVTGSYHAAGIVGTGYGSIQNCTVKNSTIIGNYAGALRGYSASGTNTGNTVENCTINGKYAAGGLFGLVTADGKNTISDNTVKNCDIYCEVPAGNSYNGIGEVVGRSASDKVVIENNMTENVTLH